MATRVSAPVLWNANNDFLNGSLVGVSVDAYVVGVVSKPSGLGIPGYAQPDSVDTLLVKDKALGDLYLLLSLAEWRTLIQPPQQSPNNDIPLTYTVGTDTPASDTIENGDLYNFTVVDVWIDGIQQDIRTLTFDPDSGSGNGKITFPDALERGQVVGILGYKN
jgi:hypothetical protein